MVTGAAALVIDALSAQRGGARRAIQPYPPPPSLPPLHAALCGRAARLCWSVIRGGVVLLPWDVSEVSMPGRRKAGARLHARLPAAVLVYMLVATDAAAEGEGEREGEGDWPIFSKVQRDVVIGWVMLCVCYCYIYVCMYVSVCGTVLSACPAPHACMRENEDMHAPHTCMHTPTSMHVIPSMYDAAVVCMYL